MGEYKVRVDNTRDAAALIYLSEIYHADLLTMLLLYEKYGGEIFRFWYMLAGHNVNFPRPTKLSRILEASEQLASCIAQKIEDLGTEQEKVVLKRLRELYSVEDNQYVLTVEVMHDEQRNIDIESPKKSRVLDQRAPEDRKTDTPHLPEV